MLSLSKEITGRSKFALTKKHSLLEVRSRANNPHISNSLQEENCSLPLVPPGTTGDGAVRVSPGIPEGSKRINTGTFALHTKAHDVTLLYPANNKRRHNKHIIIYYYLRMPILFRFQ